MTLTRNSETAKIWGRGGRHRVWLLRCLDFFDVVHRRDESLEESDNLPDPDILAQEIVVPRLASLGTPSSPEPQAEGTPSQEPRSARGPRRGVEDLEAALEQLRAIAMDLRRQEAEPEKS